MQRARIPVLGNNHHPNHGIAQDKLGIFYSKKCTSKWTTQSTLNKGSHKWLLLGENDKLLQASPPDSVGHKLYFVDFILAGHLNILIAALWTSWFRGFHTSWTIILLEQINSDSHCHQNPGAKLCSQLRSCQCVTGRGVTGACRGHSLLVSELKQPLAVSPGWSKAFLGCPAWASPPEPEQGLGQHHLCDNAPTPRCLHFQRAWGWGVTAETDRTQLLHAEKPIPYSQSSYL